MTSNKYSRYNRPFRAPATSQSFTPPKPIDDLYPELAGYESFEPTFAPSTQAFTPIGTLSNDEIVPPEYWLIEHLSGDVEASFTNSGESIFNIVYQPGDSDSGVLGSFEDISGQLLF